MHVEYLDGEPETYVLPVVFVPGVAGDRLVDDHPAAALVLVDPSARATRACSSTRTGSPATGARCVDARRAGGGIRTELGSMAGAPGAIDPAR